jgi:hypothetical protein
VWNLADALGIIKNRERGGPPTSFHVSHNLDDGKANSLKVHDTEEEAVRILLSVFNTNYSANVAGGQISSERRSTDPYFDHLSADTPALLPKNLEITGPF